MRSVSRKHIVQLGEIIKLVRERLELRPSHVYQRVTVRLWGGGVVPRDEVSGSEIRTRSQYLARSGQFIFSRIDARNGAFGIVPSNLHEAVVSGNFQTFDLDSKRVLPEYLLFFVNRPSFWKACSKISEGTTNRVPVRVEEFVRLTIALPPLSEQQQLVTMVKDLIAKVEEARGLRRQAIEETEVLLAAAMKNCFDFTGANESVRSFATVQGGYAFPSNRYVENGSHQIVRIGNVRDGYLDLSRAPVGWDLQDDRRIEKHELREGDTVISMTGTRNKRDYGYVAIVPPGKRLLLNQRVGKIVPRKPIERRYLFYFLRSPFFRDNLFPRATGTANQANIGNKHIEEVPFDPPSSIEEQRCIVRYLDDLQANVAVLKQLQAETAAELDALLPSILSKAFHGEL